MYRTLMQESDNGSASWRTLGEDQNERLGIGSEQQSTSLDSESHCFLRRSEERRVGKEC